MLILGVHLQHWNTRSQSNQGKWVMIGSSLMVIYLGLSRVN
jgi:hypothetical protein